MEPYYNPQPTRLHGPRPPGDAASYARGEGVSGGVEGSRVDGKKEIIRHT